MKNAAFGALFVGLLVACGGGSGGPVVIVGDAPLNDGGDICNVLTQTGCMAGEKCTWFHDTETPSPLGHIGCAPDPASDVAVGAACTYGSDGPTGYDNCKVGNVCVSGTCKQICDDNNGTPMCPTNYACGDYTGLFDNGGMNVAGVCDKTCNPLADNSFGSAGDGLPTKTGSACATGDGCYGFPGDTTATHATCSGEFNKTLVHRSACTTANNCEPDSTHVYLNGCAQGYIPLLDDTTGSSQADCISYCAPLDCFATSTGTVAATCARTAAQTPGGTTPDGNALRGAAPHDCTDNSARGAYDVATTGGAGENGDQCLYSWTFERDTNGNYIPSPTSDTLGYCVQHKQYRYDSNGDGMVDNNDATWPKCDQLPVGSNYMPPGSMATGADATFFGCVSTTTATADGNPPFQAMKRDILIDRPRFPYHAVKHQ